MDTRKRTQLTLIYQFQTHANEFSDDLLGKAAPEKYAQMLMKKFEQLDPHNSSLVKEQQNFLELYKIAATLSHYAPDQQAATDALLKEYTNEKNKDFDDTIKNLLNLFPLENIKEIKNGIANNRYLPILNAELDEIIQNMPISDPVQKNIEVTTPSEQDAEVLEALKEYNEAAEFLQQLDEKIDTTTDDAFLQDQKKQLEALLDAYNKIFLDDVQKSQILSEIESELDDYAVSGALEALKKEALDNFKSNVTQTAQHFIDTLPNQLRTYGEEKSEALKIALMFEPQSNNQDTDLFRSETHEEDTTHVVERPMDKQGREYEPEFIIFGIEAAAARQIKFDEAAKKIRDAALQEIINQQRLDVPQETKKATLLDEKKPTQTFRRPPKETEPTTDTIRFSPYKTQKNQADENKLALSKEQKIKKKVNAIIKTALAQLNDHTNEPAYESLNEIKKSLRVYVQHAGENRNHTEIGTHIAILLETCKTEPAINAYLLDEMDVTNDIQRTSFTQALLNIQKASQNREQYDKREHEDNIHAILKNMRPFTQLRSDTPDTKFENFVAGEFKALETKIRQAQIDYHSINFYNTFGFQEPIKPLIKANILKELNKFESEFKASNGGYKENAIVNFLSPHFVIPPNKPDHALEAQLGNAPTLKKSIDSINSQAESAKNRREDARKIEHDRQLHEQRQRQAQEEKAQQQRLVEEEKIHQQKLRDNIKKSKDNLAAIAHAEKETAVKNTIEAVIKSKNFCNEKDKKYYPLETIQSLLISEKHNILYDFANKTNSIDEATLSSHLGKLFKPGQPRNGVQHILNSANVENSHAFAQAIGDLNLAAQKEEQLEKEKTRQAEADKALNDYIVKEVGVLEAKVLNRDVNHPAFQHLIVGNAHAPSGPVFEGLKALVQACSSQEEKDNLFITLLSTLNHKANITPAEIAGKLPLQTSDQLVKTIYEINIAAASTEQEKPKEPARNQITDKAIRQYIKDQIKKVQQEKTDDLLSAYREVNFQEHLGSKPVQKAMLALVKHKIATEKLTDLSHIELADSLSSLIRQPKPDQEEIMRTLRVHELHTGKDNDPNVNLVVDAIDNLNSSVLSKTQQQTPRTLQSGTVSTDDLGNAEEVVTASLSISYKSIEENEEMKNEKIKPKQVTITEQMVNKDDSDIKAEEVDNNQLSDDQNNEEIKPKQITITEQMVDKDDSDMEAEEVDNTQLSDDQKDEKQNLNVNSYQTHNAAHNGDDAHLFPNHQIKDPDIKNIDDRIPALQSIKNDLLPVKNNVNKIATTLNVDKFIENLNARLNNMRGPISRHVANFEALKDNFIHADSVTKRDEIHVKILKSNINYLIDGLNGYKNDLDRYEAHDPAKIKPYRDLLAALTALQKVSNKAWYHADVSQTCKTSEDYEDFFKKIFHQQVAPGAIKPFAHLHATPEEGTITDALSHEAPYRAYAALLTDKIEAGKPISDYAAGWFDQLDPKTGKIDSKLVTIPNALKTETVFMNVLAKAKDNGILSAYQFKGTLGFEETLKIHFQDRHVTSDTVKEFLKKHFDLSAKLNVGNTVQNAKTGILNLVRTEQKSFENRIADLICKEYNNVMTGKNGLPCDMLLTLAIKQIENMRKAQRHHGMSELVFTAKDVFNDKYAQALSYYCQAQGYKFTNNTKYGVGSIYQLKDREQAIQHIKKLAAESTKIEFDREKVIASHQPRRP